MRELLGLTIRRNHLVACNKDEPTPYNFTHGQTCKYMQIVAQVLIIRASDAGSFFSSRGSGDGGMTLFMDAVALTYDRSKYANETARPPTE